MLAMGLGGGTGRAHIDQHAIILAKQAATGCSGHAVVAS